MYPLPDNNFNRIAFELMRDSRNYVSRNATLSQYGTKYYRFARTLSDGRGLSVNFSDAFLVDEHGPKSHSVLEIKLGGSDTNPMGFDTKEDCWTNHRELAQEGGIHSWVHTIGNAPNLRSFKHFMSPGEYIEYFDISFGKSGLINAKKIERLRGRRDFQPMDLTTEELEEIISKYKMLGDEVLEVLKGETDRIAVS